MEIVELSGCVRSPDQFLFVALTTVNIAACLREMDKACHPHCLQLQQGVETHGRTFAVQQGQEESS